jgi:gamma-glutamylcyclotransferase (GGCT)/AIG2-like uncharacterized protein YtfP
MNPHLFVYGSLVSTSGHAMSERLRSEARPIGEATLQGRLYKITWYPGAVASGNSSERVHGEVYMLENPDRALAWLDEYEGLVPGNPDQGEYERSEQPVRLATGLDLTAWVYLYRGDVAGLHSIPEGRWNAGAR